MMQFFKVAANSVQSVQCPGLYLPSTPSRVFGSCLKVKKEERVVSPPGTFRVTMVKTGLHPVGLHGLQVKLCG